MADNRVIVELGTVIKNRGEWDSLAQNAKLYKDNVVQYNGSAYIVKSAPASGIGKDILPTNTAYYEVFAGVGEVATGSDFDAPSAAQRGKITTVGAVLDGMNDGVYNLTAKTGDSYATLNDALIAANNTIPINKKRGGMSICFINSIDHKYVQYRLMADEFTTDTTQWAIADVGVYVKNPEWIYVLLDAENRILAGIKSDGSVEWSIGIPTPVKTYIDNAINEIKNGTEGTDLDGLNKIIAFLSELSTSDTLKDLIDYKVDKEEGKSLIDSEYAGGVHYIKNPEFVEVKLDSEGRILEAISPDGTKLFGVGIKVNNDADIGGNINVGGNASITGDLSFNGADATVIENPEFACVFFDKNKKILFGVNRNNDFVYGSGVPSQIVEYVESKKDEIIREVNGIISDIFKPLDDRIITVPKIYGRRFEPSKAFFHYNNSIYPEGLINDTTTKVVIDGGRGTSPNLGLTNTLSKNVVLSDGKVSAKIQVAFENKSVSDVTGKKFVLCIGESTTEAKVKDPLTQRNDRDAWGWPSAIRKFNLMDKADGADADVILLGTRGYRSDVIFEYKGSQYNLDNAMCEGYSGWPSYTFLNWPTLAKLAHYGNRFWAKTMWYGLGLCTKTVYNAASYNADREEYDGSANQMSLLTSTPFGKYKVDGSEDLWVLMQNLSGQEEEITHKLYPVFADTTSSYTGSSEQLEMMQDWADALANNPMNPFYDIDEARTGVSGTAFSLSKYIERYRTLDDAGNRLVGSAGETVIGGDGNTYTIGTLITQSTLAKFNVCTPTHVIINIGINDSENAPNASPNSSDNTVANIKSFVSRFSVPTAYFICRKPGCMNIGQWEDIAVIPEYEPIIHNVEVVEKLQPWFALQQGKYMLPIYAIQYPCSVYDGYIEEEVYPTKRIHYKSDVHPGIYAYKSIGFQCLSWIYIV